MVKRRRAARSASFALLDWVALLAVYSLVLLTPFVFSIKAKDQFRFPKELFAQVAIATALASWFVSRSNAWFLPSNPPQGWARIWADIKAYLKVTPLAIPLLLFNLWCFLTLLFTPSPPLTCEALLNVLLYTAIYFSVVAFLPKEKARTVLLLVFVAGLLTAFNAILQYYNVHPLLYSPFAPQGRARESATGFLDNPNTTGALLAISLIASVCCLFLYRSYAKMLIALLLPMILVVLGITQTLGAILGLLAVLFVLPLFVALAYRTQRRVVVTMMVLLFALASLSASTLILYKPLRERLDRKVSELKARDWYALLSKRSHAWLITFEMIKARPIAGHGLGTFKLIYPDYKAIFQSKNYTLSSGYFNHAFNEYLQVWAELGLIGLSLLLILIANAFMTATRYLLKAQDLGERVIVLGFVASLLFVCINGAVNFTFHLAVLASSVMVLTGAAMRICCEDKKSAQEEPKPERTHKRLKGSSAKVPTLGRLSIQSVILLFAALVITHAFGRYQASLIHADVSNRLGALSPGSASPEALRDLELKLSKAAFLDPANFEYPFLLGIVYSQLGDYQKALDQYKKARRLSGDESIYMNQGYIYLILNDHQKARQMFERVIWINPRHEGAKAYLKGLSP